MAREEELRCDTGHGLISFVTHLCSSVFICGSKCFWHQSAAAVFFSGETLKAERREAIAEWMKRAVMGVPS
jgi:hypothetical protein